MEIDLTELETLEKKISEKRQTNPTAPHERNIDELDEYLDRLALDLKAKDDTKTTIATDLPSTSTACIEKNLQNRASTGSSNHLKYDELAENTPYDLAKQITHKPSFVSLLFGLLSILAFVNSVRCKILTLLIFN